jgi:hypothetical protein
MRYLLMFSFVSLIMTSSVEAQNEFDVLRLSELDHYGDARFNAMGGSFGALGANMSGISINPGGLGVYKSSDFAFTPSFHYNYTESDVDSKITSQGRLSTHFANIGLVGNLKGDGDWKSFNFAAGYNRTSNYNANISIRSQTNSSALGSYVNELNDNGGTFEDDISNAYPFSSSLAYQTFLVNPILGDSLQYNHVFSNVDNITQVTRYETRGGSGEMYIAFGGNYSDKLYLGALIGIPKVRYTFDRYYRESSDPSDTLTEFKSYAVHDYVRTTGTGLNLKLGMIYKAADWLRLGAAFHTPTLLSLTDQYRTDMTSEKKDGSVFIDETPSGSFNYLVTTPYRLVSSASVVLGSHGVINVDYELVDYATARISEDTQFSNGVDFFNENDNIRSNFKMTQNLRIGSEIRLDPYRIRLGYRLQGDPLVGGIDFNTGASIYSAGFGIKKEGYYIDMAYSLKSYSTEAIINASQEEFATTSLTDHYLTFTLGFRF